MEFILLYDQFLFYVTENNDNNYRYYLECFYNFFSFTQMYKIQK